ncbi:hypercellular protein [Verticillium alfalfae VaMs.102]|uniref:Hypercellular protein n=1 Tax=Verticillium alfalfae (strain VaMs.102 / ATCC MYA-4576 / FGSC 10136) TaxID=526221 RepID=C9S8N5_VERA1|nr:hypercellular protein [Verticillium alfalfae VaMs.102]EEY13996.1 hypercellular protein [Verticillium alfalfae VaMs.102]
MSLDSLLPIAPARVKALALPVGPIKSERFAGFLERLREEHVVHLRDVTPDGRPNRNMFSPLAFPDGAMFYDLSTHVPPPSHLALSPFDLYREPLAIVAIADGAELNRGVFSKRHSPIAPTTTEQNVRALYQELEDLRDGFAKALVHHVLIFDFVAPADSSMPIPEGIITIPPIEACKRTTLKTLPPRNDMQNGTSWGWVNEAVTHALERASQHVMPTSSRSNSTSGLPDRNLARMSMPPVSSKTSSSLPSSSATPDRPSTPARSGLSNPPTTFDEISGGGFSDPSTPEPKSVTRAGTDEHSRAQSQDRVSVQGFGPGGMNERWRNKGRGRVLVILGSLYLQAGRWSDALKELSEGATVARSINDHVWHGKALELIVVSLLLLGWARIEFQVPAVCLPQDKASTASLAANDAATPDDPLQPKYLRKLQVALPDLLERITGLYSRISAEHLPPLPAAEVTIRFCKLLSALHFADGKLGDRAFASMVYGKLPEKPLTTAPRLTISPTRQQIVNQLFRAFPSSASELLTVIDRATILAGIASVLGPLGHQRKKAMVLRELVSVLIGGLVEARTRGAADVGIHPAAGLVALNAAHGHSNGAMALELGEGDVEQGVDAFLGMLCRSYGVVGYEMRKPLAETAQEDPALARIQGQAAARFFGFPGIKLNILRACINFSEALPDFNGVLKYSSDLLRSAGSGVAPGPRREDASPSISREEQIRLATNIAKTSNLTRRLGLQHLAAEYWDEFLVRDVSLDLLPSTRIPVPHAKSTLPGAAPRARRKTQTLHQSGRALRRLDKTTERFIAPGATATFAFEILGKPGLTSAALQIDYAHLGVPPEAIVDKFHTRRVSLQLTVTVNASVELARLEVLPLHGRMPAALWTSLGGAGTTFEDRATSSSDDAYCLLTMDLRNAWPSHVKVTVETTTRGTTRRTGTAARRRWRAHPAGHTARVVMAPAARVLRGPARVDPGASTRRGSAVVVSTSRSPDVERVTRGVLVRERMLRGSRAVDDDVGPRRSGSTTSASTYRWAAAAPMVRSSPSPSPATRAAAGGGSHEVVVDAFSQLRVRVTNRTAQAVYPLLRLMPSLCHRPLNVALDFTRKVSWNGTLQQALPVLGPRATTEVVLGFTALCRGAFEVTASVEEYQVWAAPVKEAGETTGATERARRPRSDTQAMLDAALGVQERRIWHSRQPCVVVARDAPGVAERAMAW